MTPSGRTSQARALGAHAGFEMQRGALAGIPLVTRPLSAPHVRTFLRGFGFDSADPAGTCFTPTR